MREVFYLLGFSLIIWWFFARRKVPALEASEMLQLPALRHDERPWTKLDELVLNVARHDVLAQWHRDGRQLLLDTPVHDVNEEGGWNVTSDEFGEDIGDRYEHLFLELRTLPTKRRTDVLRAAEAKSREARLEFRKMEIRHPDGTLHEFPSWMTNS